MIFIIYSNIDEKDFAEGYQDILDSNMFFSYVSLNSLNHRLFCITLANKFLVKKFNMRYSSNKLFTDNKTKQIFNEFNKFNYLYNLKDCYNGWLEYLNTIDFESYWKEFLSFNCINLNIDNLIMTCLDIKEINLIKSVYPDTVTIYINAYDKECDYNFDYISNLSVRWSTQPTPIEPIDIIKLNIY